MEDSDEPDIDVDVDPARICFWWDHITYVRGQIVDVDIDRDFFALGTLLYSATASNQDMHLHKI